MQGSKREEEMPYADSGGIRIHFEVEGTGPRWCFSMESHNAWKIGSSVATSLHFGRDTA
jgi:hypothetical protein